jgi:hypothetical protein
MISESADFEHYFSGRMNSISLEQLGDTGIGKKIKMDLIERKN